MFSILLYWVNIERTAVSFLLPIQGLASKDKFGTEKIKRLGYTSIRKPLKEITVEGLEFPQVPQHTQ